MNNQSNTPQFRLTKEESAVMDKCRTESFWYRSVPFCAITAAVLTWGRINNRISPKFYGFKVFTGITFAYALGKISYITTCRKKILEQLPDSNLARAVLNQQNPYSREFVQDIVQPPQLVPSSIYTTDESDDEHHVQQKLLPVETPREDEKRYYTYDELRKKNREEYDSRFRGTKQKNGTTSTNERNIVVKSPEPPSRLEDRSNSRLPTQFPTATVDDSIERINRKDGKKIRRNQYGDEVYE